MAISRNIQDYRLLETVNLPAAGATAKSDSVDLGPGFKGEDFEVRVSIPALPNLATGKTVTGTLLHAPVDDVSMAVPIPQLAPFFVTGEADGETPLGSPEYVYQLRIPSDTQRYLFLQVATATGGGDNTAVAAVMQLLF